MEKKKFTILGGDKRSIELANLLIKEKHYVKIYGFDKLDTPRTNCKFHEAITDADVIIGPLPMSEDGTTLNAPFSNEKIIWKDVVNLLSAGQIYTAGKIEKDMYEIAKNNNIQPVDYFKREEMQILNAIPTAEGAIQVAMENTLVTLHGTNTIVLGFGRIGKIIAKLLKALDSNVYVAARRYDDLAWIKNYGYTPVNFKDLSTYLENMSVIFNTIPHIVLDEKQLELIGKDCIIIETASNPGGVDTTKAEELKIKIIKAQGLPGKVAPVTAATIIKETVYNIIDEMEASNVISK